MTMRELPKGIIKLINEAVSIEQEQAREAGAIGYMSRSMVQASLPNRRVEGTEFVRVNGNFTLSLLAPSAIGLPYGTVPRLLMVWLASEAMRTKQRQLQLGQSLTGFMRQMDMKATGGVNGSITRFKEQSKRLFATSITGLYEGKHSSSLVNQRIADQAEFWWDTGSQRHGSEVLLSESFFREIMDHPVPVDLRAIHALKNSPMALDIYSWLTYRASYAKRSSAIPWAALAAQFGGDYSRLRDFKASFCTELQKVCVVYPDVQVVVEQEVLIIEPAKPHVRQSPKGKSS